MSRVEAAVASFRQSFPIDLGWRNFVFSLRTAVAGIATLAIAYWLGLQEPGWSILTVYLLAQPMAGAVLAKGMYRILGTVIGALWGMFVLSLYADAAVPFVGAMVIWLGLCIYAAVRTTNFVSYAFLLAGYSALLVGYEGAAAPTAAWSIAVDRSAEIIIGILCTAAVSILVMPRYAGEALRSSLVDTFSGLAHYGSMAMRPTTPFDTFIALRRRMVGAVVQFDALRSYTRFESEEMRVDDGALRRVLREFLSVLAVARGLYFRLEDFSKDESGRMVLDRLRPALKEAEACLERISKDPGAVADPRRTRHELLAVRRILGAAAEGLGDLIGKVRFDFLADGVLVIHRASDMIHGLSMVMAAEEAALLATARGRRPRRRQRLAPVERLTPVIHGLRAALALLAVSVFWAATSWSAGFSAIVGLSVMLFIVLKQENPAHIGWSYLAAVCLALVGAFVAMVFVLPRLEGFDSLSLFLMAVLLPAGLVVGTPRFALVGAGFGAFFVSEVSTGNVYQPDLQTYVNGAIGMVIGMVVCLVTVMGLVPVSPSAVRRKAWTQMLRSLPAAARGERPERAIAGDILALLADLLPRLDLDKAGDEDLLRGSLGVASMSIELWRLNDRKDDPRTPAAARETVRICLDRLAEAFGHLPGSADRAGTLADAEKAVSAAGAALAEIPIEADSPEARAVVRAAASLRFISDRFGIDRAFFLLSSQT